MEIRYERVWGGDDEVAVMVQVMTTRAEAGGDR
jgi:hypothetical protein